MISAEFLITGIFLTLAIGVLFCIVFSKPDYFLKTPVISSVIVLLLSIPAGIKLFNHGAYTVYGSNFLIDALSMYHIFLVNFVFLISSIYATGYFKNQSGLRSAYLRRFCMLWQAFHAMLLIVLLSNHIGIMWIALEARHERG